MAEARLPPVEIQEVLFIRMLCGRTCKMFFSGNGVTHCMRPLRRMQERGGGRGVAAVDAALGGGRRPAALGLAHTPGDQPALLVLTTPSCWLRVAVTAGTCVLWLTCHTCHTWFRDVSPRDLYQGPWRPTTRGWCWLHQSVAVAAALGLLRRSGSGGAGPGMGDGGDLRAVTDSGSQY